jgi:hypothetical protein
MNLVDKLKFEHEKVFMIVSIESEEVKTLFRCNSFLNELPK